MKNVLEGTIGGTFTQESPKQARKCFPALKRVQNVKHVCAIQIVKTNSITFQITLQLKSNCQILHESCKLSTIDTKYVFLKITCNEYANKHSHTNVHYFEHHLSNSHTMSSNNSYHEYKQSIKHTCKHSIHTKEKTQYVMWGYSKYVTLTDLRPSSHWVFIEIVRTNIHI
jgi:hypothetical protein